MSLLLVILATIASIAALGVHGLWVFLIGLGLLSAIEKKHPGTNFVEGAVSIIGILIVVMMAAEILLRTLQG